MGSNFPEAITLVSTELGEPGCPATPLGGLLSPPPLPASTPLSSLHTSEDPRLWPPNLFSAPHSPVAETHDSKFHLHACGSQPEISSPGPTSELQPVCSAAFLAIHSVEI